MNNILVMVMCLCNKSLDWIFMRVLFWEQQNGLHFYQLCFIWRTI